MSKGGLKKRYTSAMEKIVKNAVSETSKVLETIIAELKAEVLRVKSENENLKIRCCQFEEVVKKRSVYRETGTSPEPYIIEKCDKAVQCDFALQKPENLDPNLSDIETQSERSCELIYEKESSNDSFSFTNVSEDDNNTNNVPLDISVKTTPEKYFDQETNANDDRPEEKKMEHENFLEMDTFSSEQEITTTISSPQVQLHEEHGSYFETSEMEIQDTFQENVIIECSNTDNSLLECQDEGKIVANEGTAVCLQEDALISTEEDGLIGEKSTPIECEYSIVSDPSNEIAQQLVVEMDFETDPQTKLLPSEINPDDAFSGDTSNTELGNSLVLADNYVSSVQDQSTTPSVVTSTVTLTEPEQRCSEIDATEVQSVPTEDSNAKKAKKNSPTLKYSYFLRRQRHTSVTLEDAMLLLDAVNLHEYKSSITKKGLTKQSLKLSKNYPELTPTKADDSLNLEENVSTTVTISPQMAEVHEHKTSVPKKGQTKQSLRASKKDLELTPKKAADSLNSEEIVCITETIVPQTVEVHEHKSSITTKGQTKQSLRASKKDTKLTLKKAADSLNSEEIVCTTETISPQTAEVHEHKSSITKRRQTKQSLRASKKDTKLTLKKAADSLNSEEIVCTTETISPQTAEVHGHKSSITKKGQTKQSLRASKKDSELTPKKAADSLNSEEIVCITETISPQTAEVHEHKSSSTKRGQTKQSLRASKKKPELTPKKAADSLNSEEIVCTTETIVPQMTEVIEEVSPAHMGINGQQHDQETIPCTKPSLEVAIDHGVLMVTPTKLTLVTEADSMSMDIEDQPLDHKNMSPPTIQSSTSTDNTTLNTSPAKQCETMPAVENDTANIYIEGQENEPIVANLPAKQITDEPDPNIPVPPITTSGIQSKQDENVEEVEVTECPAEIDIDSQNHDYKSWSLIPSARTSSADDCAVLLSTSTEQCETAQANLVDLTHPTIASEPVTLSEPDPTTQANPDDSVAQISGLPTLHSEGEESNVTSSLALSEPNSVMQHTLLLKMPAETGDQSSSVLKTLTSSSTLSPAQLRAVVSAVRSTQNAPQSIPGSSHSITSNKKLVAVPFSLQAAIRPHHKIIVIPRQCKIPPSQPIAKHKSIVLKQNQYELDSTTTVVSTNDVNRGTCSVVKIMTPELDKKRSPAREISPCKNTVQVKLNRLQFPVLSAQAVSVTNRSPDASFTSGRPQVEIISEISTKQPVAQPAKDDFSSPVIESSPKLSGESNASVQTSSRRKVKSNSPPPKIILLSPAVCNDHSYPQNSMTKSQFLAKLEVSPVIQDSEKAGSSGKGVQKASLVDRLRSHLKKVQDGANLAVETPDGISITQVASGSNQEQHSENSSSPDHTPDVYENKSESSSPVTKSVSRGRPAKRKNSPKADTIAETTPVKKCRKSGASSENKPLRGNLTPMRNKLINSNALLSCVRKGISKKSFLCKFCRKEFSKKREIEEHIQVHAGKRPFQCNICHRRFSKTMELSRHLKRHSAEKKYHCSFCGKAFIELNNLKRHIYIHTGEKPFACPHCPKSFTQSGHMRSHMKSFHKDVKN